MITNNNLQNYFFLLALLGVLILAFFIFLPYLNALLLAAVFAILFRPLYRQFKIWTGGQGTAAFCTLIVVLILIITPLFFFGREVFSETRNVLSHIENDGGTWGNLSAKFESLVKNIAPNADVDSIQLDLRQYASQVLSWVVGHFGSVFSSIARIIVMLFIWLIAFYYFLKDGTRLKQYMIELSPLANLYDLEIFNKMHSAVNSVIRGSLVIAVIQGVLSGVGFTIFNVPNAALWGGIAMIAALIPGVGTSLVLIPAIIYLFVTGTLGNAVGMLVWSVIAVGLIDNFLGPKLVGDRIKVHPLLILLAVLGGIGLFGPIGFITGPLVLSLLFALLDIYKSMIQEPQPLIDNHV